MPSLQYKLFSKIIALLPLKTRLDALYFRRFKRRLNVDSPDTFNQKLQLRKLLDRNNILPIAADKIASKDFVKKISKDLYIPKTIWVGESFQSLSELEFSHLPDDYVFKANHTSQTIEIIRGGEHLTLEKMQTLAKSWLSHDQSGSLGEWAYQDIPRKIFIEEFLDFNDAAPDDYKFFVYHGKVRFIQVDYDRFSNHKRNMYDSEWNDLGFRYSYDMKTPSPKKPLFLKNMIEIAESIGSEFDFIRVDLYFYKNNVTFGELTVYPGAGFEKFPEYKWDKLFGRYWIQDYKV